MPGPFEAVLLALAAWRAWHLIALDDITDRPRRYITDGRDALLEFIECPFCMGFWVALAWVGAYAVDGDVTVWVALPFAVNAGVIFINHWLSSDT